jgi:hypothetical protein
MQQITTYVGRFTAIDLKYVEQGVSSLKTLQILKNMHDNACKNNPSNRQPEFEISLNETLSILDPLEERKTKALIALLYNYQGVISEIARCPERFDTERLTPAIAQAWYANQILAIRRLLQQK